MDEDKKFGVEIPVSEAYHIIEQELRRHTRGEYILISKKIKEGKVPSGQSRKEFAGSVYWKEPRPLRSDHWIEFLIFGKPLAHTVVARASDWKHELKHEKLVLENVMGAVQAALGKDKVTIETD
jgi:hypothetical protein